MFPNEQVTAGIIVFVKREFIPMLPDWAKGIGGAVILHNAMQINEIMQKLRSSKYGTMLGIIDKDGMIDVDVWCQDIKQSMREFCDGKIEIRLPMMQPIYLRESDIDTMKRYIRGELQ